MTLESKISSLEGNSSNFINIISDISGIIETLKDYKPLVHCLKKKENTYEVKALIKIPQGMEHSLTPNVKYKDSRIRFIDVNIHDAPDNRSPYLISLSFSFTEITRQANIIPAVGVRTIKGNNDSEENILGHTWPREFYAM